MSMTEATIKAMISWFEARKGKTLKLNNKGVDFVVKALDELNQYRAIGTVYEFKQLKEKATAKEPYLFGDGYADGVPVYDEWNCPNCDTNYEVDFEHYDYCPMCGQRIDWSEGKER